MSSKITDHPALAETFRKLALEAGAQIMEVYARAEEMAVAEKADASPVTEADLAADRVISAGLAAAFPEVPAVTEEQADSHRAVSGPFFLVDPLDGTKEFVQRRGDFTVNIALIENGNPVAGVVYAPAKGRLFLGIGGRATEARVMDGALVSGSERPLAVAAPSAAGLRVVASKSHRDAATDAYIARYPVADFLSAGSSLKFCLLAAGEADLYPRLGPTMEWDTAAGHAVLAAAGGEVVRFEDHEPFTYGKPAYRNGFFIARVPGVALAAPDAAQ
ncbi:MAG: 3'(2'),5'-bisphosphate nucleotidase CysQ [Pikeienuella sp.]